MLAPIKNYYDIQVVGSMVYGIPMDVLTDEEIMDEILREFLDSTWSCGDELIIEVARFENEEPMLLSLEGNRLQGYLNTEEIWVQTLR